MKWKLRGEIGSEFWDIPLAPQENGIFPPYTVWYLSGRVALRAILSDLCARQVVRTAALPSWCCHTMIAPFSDTGIKVFFYPVFVADGVLRQEQGSCPSCDVTLVMDYFGYPRKPMTRRMEFSPVFQRVLTMCSAVCGNGRAFPPVALLFPVRESLCPLRWKWAGQKNIFHCAARPCARSRRIFAEKRMKNATLRRFPVRRKCWTCIFPAALTRRIFSPRGFWTFRFCGKGGGKTPLSFWIMCGSGRFFRSFPLGTVRCLYRFMFPQTGEMPCTAT